MNGNMDQTVVLGRLGKDAEAHYTPSGKVVTTFQIASNREWTNGDGEKCKITTWRKGELWGPLGEKLIAYLVRGKRVLLTGRDTVQAWTAKDGSAQATLVITIDKIVLLDGGTMAALVEIEELEASEEIPF